MTKVIYPILGPSVSPSQVVCSFSLSQHFPSGNSNSFSKFSLIEISNFMINRLSFAYMQV